jgi:hypothetical protein
VTFLYILYDCLQPLTTPLCRWLNLEVWYLNFLSVASFCGTFRRRLFKTLIRHTDFVRCNVLTFLHQFLSAFSFVPVTGHLYPKRIWKLRFCSSVLLRMINMIYTIANWLPVNISLGYKLGSKKILKYPRQRWNNLSEVRETRFAPLIETSVTSQNS